MLSAVTFHLLAPIFHLGSVLGKWQKQTLYTHEGGIEKWNTLDYIFLFVSDIFLSLFLLGIFIAHLYKFSLS